MGKYQCDTCHTVTDRGGTVGPVLNQVANRRTEDWIRRWLRDPNEVKPGTRMPKFDFTEDEYEEAVGYLAALKSRCRIKDISWRPYCRLRGHGGLGPLFDYGFLASLAAIHSFHERR